MKYREIVRLIKADGWRLSAQRGSHRQYEHPTKREPVLVWTGWLKTSASVAVT